MSMTISFLHFSVLIPLTSPLDVINLPTYLPTYLNSAICGSFLPVARTKYLLAIIFPNISSTYIQTYIHAYTHTAHSQPCMQARTLTVIMLAMSYTYLPTYLPTYLLIPRRVHAPRGQIDTRQVPDNQHIHHLLMADCVRNHRAPTAMMMAVGAQQRNPGRLGCRPEALDETGTLDNASVGW